MTRWPNIEYADLRHFPRGGEGSEPLPSRQQLAEGWKRCFDSLLEIRELQDDWDGQGTQAPKPELVDSAMILAVMLRQHGILPPSCTVQSVCGEVDFDWQWPDLSMLTLEVTQPFEGEVFWCPAGGETTLAPLYDPIAAIV